MGHGSSVPLGVLWAYSLPDDFIEEVDRADTASMRSLRYGWRSVAVQVDGAVGLRTVQFDRRGLIAR